MRKERREGGRGGERRGGKEGGEGREGVTETDLFLNTAERGKAPPLTGDHRGGKLN